MKERKVFGYYLQGRRKSYENLHQVILLRQLRMIVAQTKLEIRIFQSQVNKKKKKKNKPPGCNNYGGKVSSVKEV